METPIKRTFRQTIGKFRIHYLAIGVMLILSLTLLASGANQSLFIVAIWSAMLGIDASYIWGLRLRPIFITWCIIIPMALLIPFVLGIFHVIELYPHLLVAAAIASMMGILCSLLGAKWSDGFRQTRAGHAAVNTRDNH